MGIKHKANMHKRSYMNKLVRGESYENANYLKRVGSYVFFKRVGSNDIDA